MAAFACYFALCYVLDKKGWSVFLALLSLFVAYSRMYLSQHFLIDVVIGGMVGMILAMLSIRLVNSWKWRKLDYSMIQLIKDA